MSNGGQKDAVTVITTARKWEFFDLKELRVDGGACRNNFLMQFQSDILDLGVDRPAMAETTALGAAFLAGLGVGLWPDAETLAGLRETDRKFSPKMGAEERDKLYSVWLDAVSRVRSG